MKCWKHSPFLLTLSKPTENYTVHYRLTNDVTYLMYPSLCASKRAFDPLKPMPQWNSISRPWSWSGLGILYFSNSLLVILRAASVMKQKGVSHSQRGVTYSFSIQYVYWNSANNFLERWYFLCESIQSFDDILLHLRQT